MNRTVKIKETNTAHALTSSKSRRFAVHVCGCRAGNCFTIPKYQDLKSAAEMWIFRGIS